MSSTASEVAAGIAGHPSTLRLNPADRAAPGESLAGSSLAEVVEQRVEAGESGAKNELMRLLETYGIDTSSQQVQFALSAIGTTDAERLEFLSSQAGTATLLSWSGTPGFAEPLTSYQAVFQASGFDSVPQPLRLTDRKTHRMMDEITAQRGQPSFPYEYNEETGFQIFGNGTIVTPDSQVVFDPSQQAPGSEQWVRAIQGNWTEEQVMEWRGRLVNMGYLDPAEKKVRGFNAPFLSALREYHQQRYVNGGNALPWSGDGKLGPNAGLPLFDYNDIAAQVRNSVSAQLEQYYGNVPDEAEVRRWSQFVLREATDLQKRFRRKDVSSYSSAALGEAEERFIDDIRQDTQPFREAIEENTSLRDSLRSAAQVASGLV